MPEGQTISDQERSDQRVQQASRAVAWNGVLSISAALFGVAASVVTFRLLTKEQFGCLNTTTNYLRYASLLALFTLDTALLRYIPEYRARGDRKGLTDLLAKVFTVHFVVWAALVAVVAGIAGWLSAVNKADLRMLFYVGILVALPSVLSVSLQAVLTSFFRVKVQAVCTVIGGFLQLGCLWLFIRALGWGGPGAMLAQLGMSGFLVIVLLLFVVRLPYPKQTGEYSPMRLRRLLYFSAPYAFNRVAADVFGRQSEVFFLMPFYGAAAVATYGVAYQVSQRFLEFIPALFYGVGNVIAAEAYLQGRKQLARVMGVYWRILSMAVAAISIGGCALADKLTLLLFGAKGADAGPYAAVLFLTQASTVFTNPYFFVMRAEEKTWLTFWLSPPAAVISLGLDYLLIPKWGLNGALAATSLSFTLVTIMQYAVFRRVFPYLRIPWGYVLRCYAASLPMLLVVPLKAHVPGHLGFLVCLPLAMVLWCIGARALRLIGEDEADLLRRSKLPGTPFLLRILAR